MIGLPADYYPIEMALEFRREDDLLGVPEALAQMDVRLESGFELRQCILQVRSETDLVEAVSVLDRRCPGLTFGQPQVAYREKLGRAVDIDFTHKKHFGGLGAFARIKIRFEPLKSGSGYVFENAVVGGAVPDEYVPGVQRGLDLARWNGLVAGYPLIDFRATLLDGAYHNEDSNALAFEVAARGAFRELKGKGDPRLMEPMVNLTLSAPETQTAHVRQLLAQLDANEVVSLIDRQSGRLLFQARLKATFGLRKHLAQEAPGTELITMQFSGMREVPRTGGGPQVA